MELGPGPEHLCSSQAALPADRTGGHPILTICEEALGSDGPTGPTSGGTELRKPLPGVRRRAPKAPRVRARGCDWGEMPRRPTPRDSPEPKVVAGPSERPDQSASPRAGGGPWAARGRAGRRSAGRCPVTGPDSAKSRRGGSSLSGPAPVALTS